MRAMHTFLIAGLAVAAAATATGARAQLLETASPWLEAQSAPSKALNVAPSPYNGVPYMLNDVERPTPDYVNRMRSDPRFKVGINLNRYVALEAGYLERVDRGWHPVDAIDPDDPDSGDAAGGLGTRGFHTYFAPKLTLPLTDQLSAFGLLGMNYSERRGRTAVGVRSVDTDIGLFSRFGAEYKLDKGTRINVAGQNFGDTLKKWGGAAARGGTNANWLNLGLTIVH